MDEGDFGGKYRCTLTDYFATETKAPGYETE
jgi:hypothetical protein